MLRTWFTLRSYSLWAVHLTWTEILTATWALPIQLGWLLNKNQRFSLSLLFSTGILCTYTMLAFYVWTDCINANCHAFQTNSLLNQLSLQMCNLLLPCGHLLPPWAWRISSKSWLLRSVNLSPALLTAHVKWSYKIQRQDSPYIRYI